MPIYEYQCTECMHNFEYLVMGSSVPDNCPACGSISVNKQMSTCGFTSKGVSGETVASSAGTSSCSGCSSTNCSSCGSL